MEWMYGVEKVVSNLTNEFWTDGAFEGSGETHRRTKDTTLSAKPRRMWPSMQSAQRNIARVQRYQVRDEQINGMLGGRSSDVRWKG